MNRILLTPFGLKWNPFSTELPSEALYLSPKINDFVCSDTVCQLTNFATKPLPEIRG